MTGSGRIWIPYFMSLSSSKFKKPGTQRGHINKKTYSLFNNQTKEAAIIDSRLLPLSDSNNTQNAWHGSSGLVEVKSPALSLANFQVNQSFSLVLRCVWFSYQRRVNERRVCAIFSTLMNNSDKGPHLRCHRLSCDEIGSHTVYILGHRHVHRTHT